MLAYIPAPWILWDMGFPKNGGATIQIRENSSIEILKPLVMTGNPFKNTLLGDGHQSLGMPHTTF